MHEPRGFSVLEVVIALAVLATGVLAFAGLVLSTHRTVVVSQRMDVAQVAAREKLEELRSLAWTSDDGVVFVSDWSTNLTITPPSASGGVGLASSSGDTLTTNTRGFCDFLDYRGRWLAGGTTPPPATAWVRRWMAGPVDAVPDLLVLQVVVVPVRSSAAEATLAFARGVNGAWLTSMRARRSR